MFPSTHELIGSIAVIAWLCAIAWIDTRQMRIPNDALFAMLVVTLVITAWRGVGLLGVSGIEALKGMAVAAAVVIPSYVIRGLGAGDAKLAMMIGGLLGAARVVPAMLIAAIGLGVCALVAVAWKALGGREVQKFPAAVPLGLGVLAVLLFPSWLVIKL
jgi:prepilin peptidase CpaA